jgi:hypothetical protein
MNPRTRGFFVTSGCRTARAFDEIREGPGLDLPAAGATAAKSPVRSRRSQPSRHVSETPWPPRGPTPVAPGAGGRGRARRPSVLALGSAATAPRSGVRVHAPSDGWQGCRSGRLERATPLLDVVCARDRRAGARARPELGILDLQCGRGQKRDSVTLAGKAIASLTRVWRFVGGVPLERLTSDYERCALRAVIPRSALRWFTGRAPPRA